MGQVVEVVSTFDGRLMVVGGPVSGGSYDAYAWRVSGVRRAVGWLVAW